MANVAEYDPGPGTAADRISDWFFFAGSVARMSVPNEKRLALLRPDSCWVPIPLA
jgi:hypothetical protein